MRPVVIVNPLSSGVELAPAFKARGVPAIAVTLNYDESPEFGSRIRADDFIAVIQDQPGLESLIQAYDPIAILPGTEEGIALADRLVAQITPEYANNPNFAPHRAHKSLMQKALADAGVPCLKTLHTGSATEAAEWIRDQGLQHSPLILKPPSASGSEKVFHIPAGGDWRKPFDLILAEKLISGRRSETVVVQEQAIGTEFAVGTVSANGKHYLSHLMKYHKTSAGGRKTVFDHVEFVGPESVADAGLFEYTQQVLDALGIRWGAAHNEIMLTANGPRLIESSPRMIGGPVVGFSREATGSSQADKLVEIYLDGEVAQKEMVLNKTVMPVFLKSPAAGTLANAEVLDGVAQLPTLFQRHFWFKNGDRVPQTVDYLTSIGIIALAGERDTLLADYQKIREMESRLIVDR